MSFMNTSQGTNEGPKPTIVTLKIPLDIWSDALDALKTSNILEFPSSSAWSISSGFCVHSTLTSSILSSIVHSTLTSSVLSSSQEKCTVIQYLDEHKPAFQVTFEVLTWKFIHNKDLKTGKVVLKVSNPERKAILEKCDASGLPKSDIELVMSQVRVTREEVVEALCRNGGDIINAIMEILKY